MSSLPARKDAAAAADLTSLQPITDAVAARSSSDERSLMADGTGIATHELRVGDATVGRLRVRARATPPADAFLRVVTMLIGSEVERLRAPERASEAAQAGFLRALLQREVTDRDNLLALGAELGIDLTGGGAVVVVRAHHFAPTEDDWRARVLGAAERAARATAPGSIAAVMAAPTDTAGQIVVLTPTVRAPGATVQHRADSGAAAALVRRVGESIARELHASLPGFTFAVGHSRHAIDVVDLYRAGNEALLAANVAEAGPAGELEPPAVLAFEDTGAYRLLLPAMSEDPVELQRFYAETVEPLVAYDEQYETDLVQTLEMFLDCDGNVAGTAQRLFTHRHTVRYRLERVRDLCGLDVSSTDGREKLGLGLKAMRVLGIATVRGPASEDGASGGRVPRDAKDR